MSARAHISLRTQLAAMLLTIRVEDEEGKLVPFIDYETAKQLTPEQICSLFQIDHYPVRKEQGGSDAPWNLVFRPIMAHRHKTATKDIPEIAKGHRITAANEEFRRKMLAKVGRAEDGEPPPRRKRSRPMDYRKFDGTPVRGKWKA